MRGPNPPMMRTQAVTRRGFAITGCLIVLLVLFLLTSLLSRRGGSPPAPAPTPPLDGKVEFTARAGQRKYYFSRKQDRFRVESIGAGDEHNVTCVGTLSRPQDRWTVMVPDKRQFFYYSPTRGPADDTLAASRLSDAIFTRKYALAGGDSLYSLPNLVVTLTQFHPDPAAHMRRPEPGQGKYELVEYDHVRSEPVRAWQYGPVVGSRQVHEGTFQWCPQLGLAWSSVSDVAEGPIDPSLFELPAGYVQLFGANTEAMPRPVLAAALPQGYRVGSIGPGFTYEDVDGAWGHGLSVKEKATRGSTGRRGYGEVHSRRIDFETVAGAEAYAESLRKKPPQGRRERDPLADYGKWESDPTAGDASFWCNHGQLVFRRGRTVVDVAAYGYSDDDNAERHALITQVASAIDRQLGVDAASSHK